MCEKAQDSVTDMISDSTLPPLLKVAQMISRSKLLAKARAKATHERFNVFTTLLQAHDEVRLHTRFLHCLLDPKGLHDCGSLFLGLFFETLEDKLAMDEDFASKTSTYPPADDQWMVSKEAGRSEGHGQMDLLLEHPSRFGIAIENKIYANEQDDQLAGYATFLSNRYGNSSRLIYLTLDGKESGTSGAHDYIQISYTDEILAWLEKCLQATYHIVPVNQVIQQYREVVRGLTGKTLNSLDMKKTAEFIFNNPEIIRYQREIEVGIAGARVMFMDKLADGIMTQLGGGLEVRLRPDMGKESFGSHPNGALIITPPVGSALREVPFEIWVEHISKWVGLVVGIESKFDKPAKTAESIEFFQKMDQLLERQANAENYHKADRATLWDGTEWPTGWHNLIEHPIDNKRLGMLLEDFDKALTDVCTGIRKHVALMEKIYEEARSLVTADRVSAISLKTDLSQ